MANKAIQEASDQAVRAAVRAAREELSGRDDNGWRSGRPLEDPDKTKRWGFITAKPSEYLFHMRKGRVRGGGQGASCFKWPWDSVAVIPTTLQRLYFTADQVTAEKVGVQVRGLAVYRIARPELTVTMLNFSYPERAQEKLAETLRDMFVGAVRRLVANLTVDQCMARRKEALASFLLAEIAPVVSGEGKAGDSTDKGWGVVIDTIEIQDVHVLSEQVFANMQAPFRNQLMQKAREAELSRERELEQQQALAASHLRELKAQAESAAAMAEATEELKRIAARTEAQRAELEAQQKLEQERLGRQAELARLKAEQERQAIAEAARAEADARTVRAEAQAQAFAVEVDTTERQRQLEAQAAQAALARDRELEAQRQAAELERGEQQRLLRCQEAAAEDALAAERAQRAVALAQLESAGKAEVRRLELELNRMEGELQALLAARRREVENAISAEKLQSDFVNNALPQIAKVMQQQFGKVEIVAGAGDNPFAFLVHAFESVLEVARKGGLSGAATQVGAALQAAAPRPATAGNGAGKNGQTSV